MKKLLSIFFMHIIVLSVSCKKNELGGNSKISGKVKHHSKAIAFASVFIKFNATEFPGADTLIYDSKVRADENGNFSFMCYKGNYYVYGHGYDYAIPAPHIVVGGTPVKIRKNEKATLDVAVTED